MSAIEKKMNGKYVMFEELSILSHVLIDKTSLLFNITIFIEYPLTVKS